MQLPAIIYLDYNATTPVAPEVVNDMLPHFLTAYGNPSSKDHLAGWQAQEVVTRARAAVAQLINANAKEIIFTAGATEGLNLSLRGLMLPLDASQNQLITVKTEHNAVLDTCADLEKEGIGVTYLGVNENGLINLNELEAKINAQTKMVAIMMVNNETGVIQPMIEIAAICKRHGVILLSDATQAIGKIPIDVATQGLDIIVGSAHKIYGPKGVGFLYIKNALLPKLQPIVTGGGQEGKKRAGTMNVPGIVGMAKAFTLAGEDMMEDQERIASLTQNFEHDLTASLDLTINGKGAPRLFNTSNISFTGVDSDRLMQAIGSKIAASRGSACSSINIEPSHVLSAMNIPEDTALAAIRFSFGRYTSQRELEVAVELIIGAVERLKTDS